jgi:hypothetical protein
LTDPSIKNGGSENHRLPEIAGNQNRLNHADVGATVVINKITKKTISDRAIRIEADFGARIGTCLVRGSIRVEADKLAGGQALA